MTQKRIHFVEPREHETRGQKLTAKPGGRKSGPKSGFWTVLN